MEYRWCSWWTKKTIIEIKENDGLEIESFLDIDNSKNDFNPEDYKENNIYIIHFPNGQNIEYSIGIIKYGKENNSEILKAIRFEVGEGIEKKQEDFASEVMSQINSAG